MNTLGVAAVIHNAIAAAALTEGRVRTYGFGTIHVALITDEATIWTLRVFTQYCFGAETTLLAETFETETRPDIAVAAVARITTTSGVLVEWDGTLGHPSVNMNLGHN